MPHITLYRKYRPQSFSQVVGQDEAVAVLKREIASKKTGHAYLFSGPRGCGKTTVARLMAKAVNCGSPGEDGEPCGACESCRAITSGSSLDVVEIDGASNRGIDEVRELKEHVSLSPFSARHKVYIIDEVHMLTDAAFNALLKTLEEPPPSVIFIFATTEPVKVPATIRSRCQHIPFHRIDASLVVPCIRDVAEREGSSVDERALWDIAREADGSLRDALSLLEQALSLGSDVSPEKLRALFGGGSRKDLERVVSLLRKDRKEAFVELEGSFHKGLSGQRLLEGLFAVFRDLWIVKKWGPGMVSHLPLADEERRFAVEESGFWSDSLLWSGMEFFASLMPRARWGLRSDVLGGLLLGFFERDPAVEPRSREGKDMLKVKSADEAQAEKAPSAQPPGRSVDAPAGQPAHEGKPERRARRDAGTETMDMKLWKDFLESFFPDDLGLHCALLPSRPRVAAQKLFIDFDEKDRLCFEMAKTARNVAKIAARRQALGGVLGIFLCCGEDEIDIESGVFPEPAPVEEETDPEGTVGVESAEGRDRDEYPKRRKPPQAAPAAGGAEGKNGKAKELNTVMSLFDAELLFVKEEINENGESGGDIVE